MPASGSGALREIALVFLKLGATSFGGPAAHVAMMEQELVRRRAWLDDREFLDLLGATNLIPGPNSTEMAIHIGRRRGGWPGLLVAGVCFILPATLIVLCGAWAYVRFGSRPAAAGLLYGVKPVALAVVAVALFALRRAALRSRTLALVAMAAVTVQLAGDALVDLPTVLLALAGSGLLTSTRLNAAWLMLAGALYGVAVAALR